MEAFVNAPRLFSSSKSQLLKSSSSSLLLSSSSSGAHSRLFANSKITKKKEYRDTCTGVYPACTSWLQSLQDNVVLVLVGNELYQQLPTVGYGGIETSVDNIASALHQMKIPFIGLVPKRKLVQDLGFRILETEIFANGKVNLSSLLGGAPMALYVSAFCNDTVHRAEGFEFVSVVNNDWGKAQVAVAHPDSAYVRLRAPRRARPLRLQLRP
jgi:hypothetical protein